MNYMNGNQVNSTSVSCTGMILNLTLKLEYLRPRVNDLVLFPLGRLCFADDFSLIKEELSIFRNGVWLARLICLIVLKCLIFTSDTRKRAQNVTNVKLKFSQIKNQIEIKNVINTSQILV